MAKWWSDDYANHLLHLIARSRGEKATKKFKERILLEYQVGQAVWKEVFYGERFDDKTKAKIKWQRKILKTFGENPVIGIAGEVRVDSNGTSKKLPKERLSSGNKKRKT